MIGWVITKYAATAAVVVLVSEAAKRSDKLGGFVAALPLVTRFQFAGVKAGDKLAVAWLDNKGQRGSAEAVFAAG